MSQPDICIELGDPVCVEIAVPPAVSQGNSGVVIATDNAASSVPDEQAVRVHAALGRYLEDRHAGEPEGERLQRRIEEALTEVIRKEDGGQEPEFDDEDRRLFGLFADALAGVLAAEINERTAEPAG